MGATPQGKNITIEFNCQFRVQLLECKFSSIMKAFMVLLPQVLADFFQKVLVAFAEYEMACEKSLLSVSVAMASILSGRHGTVSQQRSCHG